MNNELDWDNLQDKPRLNPAWNPPLQELIYEAISYCQKDGADQDEDCGEQVVERLLIAIRDELRLRHAHSATWMAIGARQRELENALRETCEIIRRNGDALPKRIADLLRTNATAGERT